MSLFFPHEPNQQDHSVARDIELFRSECIHARSVFVHYRELFQTESGNRATHIAPYFFGDICRALKLYLLVEVCKLTDSTGTTKRNRNLTTEFLKNSITDQNLAAQIAPIFGRLRHFRKLAKYARDKLGSHLDLSTMRGAETVGAIDDDAWNTFWLDLQEFVYLLSDHYLGEPLFINAVSNQSDVGMMIAALEAARS